MAGAGVSISLITLDEQVWRALEPDAVARQRLRAMERLAAAGVPVGLALAPVLPGLTDAPAALEAVVRAAAEHGAQWLWSGTLHLEPAVRDVLLAALERHFPAAAPGYARVYGEAGAAGPRPLHPDMPGRPAAGPGAGAEGPLWCVLKPSTRR